MFIVSEGCAISLSLPHTVGAALPPLGDPCCEVQRWSMDSVGGLGLHWCSLGGRLWRPRDVIWHWVCQAHRAPTAPAWQGNGLVAIMVTAGLVWPRLLPCMPACCPLVCGPPCWAPPLWWMCAALVGPGSGSCAGPRGLSPPLAGGVVAPLLGLGVLVLARLGRSPLAGGAMPALLGQGIQVAIAASTAARHISLLLSSPHRLKTTGLAARHQALMVVFFGHQPPEVAACPSSPPTEQRPSYALGSACAHVRAHGQASALSAH